MDGQYQKIADLPEENWVWSSQHKVDMHMPENWGFVQFRTDAPEHGVDVPLDPSWNARYLAFQYYYAQHAYLQANQEFAKTLAQLDNYFQADGGAAAKPCIDLKHVDLTNATGTPSFLAQIASDGIVASIRADSLINVTRADA